MTHSKLHFVIGQKDPESEEIERVILSKKLGRITHAQFEGGPVGPRTAYEADPIGRGYDDFTILIECRPRGLSLGETVILIDHHHQGDPGWDASPSEYWRGSSLGQLMNLMRLPANRRQRAIAAMDHCFAAAIRGECPGAPPSVVLQVKIDEIAKAHKVSGWKVRRHIRAHRGRLKHCDSVSLGSERVVDYREADLGEGYTLELLTAQVAAADQGIPVLLSHRDPGGREKVTLTGLVERRMVQTFLEHGGREYGLIDLYGVPERGYAGGYLQ
jgi:hypothetical protein